MSEAKPVRFPNQESKIKNQKSSASTTQRLTLLGLLIAVGLMFLVHVGYGGTNMVLPLGVLRELWHGQSGDPSPENAIVWLIRLPRACGCLLIGGALGVVGSAFQAMFRNPLAEPYTVGVASGAAVGGVSAQIIGIDMALGGLGMPLMAIGGGILSLLLVLALAKRRGAVDVTTLLLAGVVVGALLSAVLSGLLLLSGQDTNQLYRWLLGHVDTLNWNMNLIMLLVLAVGSTTLIAQTRHLNAFAIGEETAQRLGVNTGRLKWIVLGTGTVMAATTVGMAGIVTFLGLVAPHISRRILGVDWRWSLSGSLLVGSGLMLASDLVAQWLLPLLGHPVLELPVGLVTALLGAPSLLILLRKSA